MPLFELAVATAVFTLYGCFSCNVLYCSRDDDDQGRGRASPASPAGYGSITTQPAHRPLPSPSYSRDRHTPSKSTVKTPLVPDHGGNFSHPTRSHISQQPEPSRLPVVPHRTAALAVRAQCPSLSSSSRRPTPALQSTSSRDPHAHNRPRERETIRRAPLASLSNLSVPQPDEGQNVEGNVTGEDLREQARRRKDEMRKAHKLADRARREGNRDAKDRYERDALVQRRAMESLNKAAAKLIFKEKNKVRRRSCRDAKVMHVQSPFFHVARGAPRERLTFTGCPFQRPLNTQSRNFSRPP